MIQSKREFSNNKIILTNCKNIYNKNVFSRLQGGFMTNTICKTIISVAIIIAVIITIKVTKKINSLWAYRQFGFMDNF